MTIVKIHNGGGVLTPKKPKKAPPSLTKENAGRCSTINFFTFRLRDKSEPLFNFKDQEGWKIESPAICIVVGEGKIKIDLLKTYYQD